MRRQFLKALAIAGLGHSCAWSRPLPKSIRIIVPGGAGGPIDVQARVLAQELQPLLGTSIYVENKPGAAGLIGGGEVARAAPDGATLLYSPDYIVTQAPHALKRMSFDPYTGLVPIARVSELAPVLLAGKAAPFSTLPEMLADAKAHQDEVSYASWGTGTGAHIYGEILAKRNGVRFTHVPYKTSGDAMTDVLTNRVQFTFQPPAVALQYPGKINAIATAGVVRNPSFPQTPTFLELGQPGFEMGGWLGFYAPKGISADLVKVLHAAINEATTKASVKAMCGVQGCLLVHEPTEGITEKLRKDAGKWGAYFAELGIEPQ